MKIEVIILLLLPSLPNVVGEWYIDPDVCNVTIPRDLSYCNGTQNNTCDIGYFSKHCPNDSTESVLNISPFQEMIQDMLKSVMQICCNPCKPPTNFRNYTNTTQLYDSILDETETSTFIFPILGTKSTKKLYNRYFLPAIDIPKATLATKQKNGTMIMESIMKSCFNLLPLLAVCILMAFASGVIIWFLDTWKNEEQFPRNFAYGIYEGFWWAFISMTTVGYGDKAPVSILARVFGVLWILVGITICSMFTAALTAVITNAAQPLSKDIAGKNIVVLKNRYLDATFTLSGGGIIYKELSEKEVIEELRNDNDVYGLVTDFISASFIRKEEDKHKDIDRYDYQEIDFSSHEYTYGILVKEKKLYDYLKEFVLENQLFYTNCNIRTINDIGKRKETSRDPFHPDNGVFLKALLIMFGICVIFLIFGLIFECVKKWRKLNSEKRKKNEEEIVNDIKSLLEEWTKLRKDNNNNA